MTPAARNSVINRPQIARRHPRFVPAAMALGLALTAGAGSALARQAGVTINPTPPDAADVTQEELNALLAPPKPTDEATRVFRVNQRTFERQIRKVYTQYLRNKRNETTRARGYEELSRITDPAAVQPLIEVLRDDAEARHWLFGHLANAVDPKYGQATLTWLSIYDDDKGMRAEAREFLARPADGVSRAIVSQSLRAGNHDIVNAGGLAAAQLKLVETIPLLIQAQAGSTGREPGGDLAFISIGETRFFVSDLQPVVGDNSAGFDPTLSPLREGVVMAVQDAVVEFHRWDVHNALVNLVKDDYGQSVDFGFDRNRWATWYRQEYAPWKAQHSAPAPTPKAAPTTPSEPKPGGLGG